MKDHGYKEASMVHHDPPWSTSQHHVQKFYDSAWTMVKPRLYHDFD